MAIKIHFITPDTRFAIDDEQVKLKISRTHSWGREKYSELNRGYLSGHSHGDLQTQFAVRHRLNSEVLPAASVAVAVILLPTGKATGTGMLKLETPVASVVTFAEPRKVFPSP